MAGPSKSRFDSGRVGLTWNWRETNRSTANRLPSVDQAETGSTRPRRDPLRGFKAQESDRVRSGRNLMVAGVTLAGWLSVAGQVRIGRWTAGGSLAAYRQLIPRRKNKGIDAANGHRQNPNDQNSIHLVLRWNAQRSHPTQCSVTLIRRRCNSSAKTKTATDRVFTGRCRAKTRIGGRSGAPDPLSQQRCQRLSEPDLREPRRKGLAIILTEPFPIEMPMSSAKEPTAS